MKKYFDILGLPVTASEADIKKRYRELVLKFHPDVNGEQNAHEKFIVINLAYKKLMGDHSDVENLYAQYQARKSGKKYADPEESYREKREQMRARANEYARARQKEAAETEQQVFEWLTRGIIWYLVRFFAVCSVVFGLFVFVDFFIKPNQNTSRVKYKVFYEHFHRNTIFVESGEHFDVPELVYINIIKGDTLSVEHSALMREFLGYRVHKIDGSTRFFANDFNFYIIFPLAPFLFFLPGLLLYYQENAVRFYLLYFVSFFVYPALLWHYIFREDKVLHIWNYFFS